MKLLVAPAYIGLLLLLVAPGYSTFFPGNSSFDDALATKLENKHFCPLCVGREAAAVKYSIVRNTYCVTNGCWETGRNTVFVADFTAQQGTWYRDGRGIFSHTRFDVYTCSDIPTSTSRPHPGRGPYCILDPE